MPFFLLFAFDLLLNNSNNKQTFQLPPYVCGRPSNQFHGEKANRKEAEDLEGQQQKALKMRMAGESDRENENCVQNITCIFGGGKGFTIVDDISHKKRFMVTTSQHDASMSANVFESARILFFLFLFFVFTVFFLLCVCVVFE